MKLYLLYQVCCLLISLQVESECMRTGLTNGNSWLHLPQITLGNIMTNVDVNVKVYPTSESEEVSSSRSNGLFDLFNILKYLPFMTQAQEKLEKNVLLTL